MGLFQQAALKQNLEIEEIEIVEKKKIGLLNRIHASSSYDLVQDSFRDYLLSVKAERGGILCSSEEGFYTLLLNNGFDLTTVRRFCPQQAFVTQILSECMKWTAFSITELTPFRSFFSSRENDSLSTIYIRSVDCKLNTLCYLVLADSRLNVRRDVVDLELAEKNVQSLIDVFSANKKSIIQYFLDSNINLSSH